MAKRKRGRVLTREVLAEMRRGASIMTGGSRCHTSTFFRDGGWWIEDFDEGHVQERPTSEATVLDLIRREKDKARAIIRHARWREFSAAFLRGGDPREALERLEESRRFGERFRYAEILELFLRCPPTLDPEERKLLTTALSGYTAYHAFMEAAGRDRSPETARKGALFVSRLIELTGPCPGCYGIRAEFHETAGDLPAALADAERELAQTPPNSPQREARAERVAALRAKLEEDSPPSGQS